MINSQLIILSLLREDDENDTAIITVCFWTDPADEVQALFQSLNTGVIRKIIPRQPLWAKEVGVFFFFSKIETLNHNLGQGSFSQLIQVHNEWHQRGPYKTKDNDGSE